MSMFDVDAFKYLILSVDPEATKYEGDGGDAYTVWTPYGVSRYCADGGDAALVYKIQVDRYTQDDNDGIAAGLYAALESCDYVAFEYLRDYEPDTGYHHHIYDCELL